MAILVVTLTPSIVCVFARKRFFLGPTQLFSTPLCVPPHGNSRTGRPSGADTEIQQSEQTVTSHPNGLCMFCQASPTRLRLCIPRGLPAVQPWLHVFEEDERYSSGVNSTAAERICCHVLQKIQESINERHDHLAVCVMWFCAVGRRISPKSASRSCRRASIKNLSTSDFIFVSHVFMRVLLRTSSLLEYGYFFFGCHLQYTHHDVYTEGKTEKRWNANNR